MATTRATMTGSLPGQTGAGYYTDKEYRAAPNGLNWGAAQKVDPRMSPYFRPQDVGDGQQTLGNGNGAGYFDFTKVPGFEGFATGGGTGENADMQGINADQLQAALAAKGYTLRDIDENTLTGATGLKYPGSFRWIEDKDGNVVGDRQFTANTGVSDQQDFLKVMGAAALGGYMSGGETAAGTTAATTQYAPATNAALAESAAGTAGYGASSAGAGGGATASWGAGAGYTADAVAGGSTAAPTSTGGYWNGTDFSGTAPQAGSSNLGTTATGAKGMGTADWLNAGLTAYSIANQPDAPNTDGINDAARDSAQLSKDAFDWFKGEFERTRTQRDEAAARDGKIADAQLEGMNFATQQAKDLADRNKTVFQPVEDRIVSESMNFDTPARRAQAVAEATADVESAAGRAQQANSRAMMRAGVTLDSPAAAALAQDASLAKAKMVAGSTGAATRNVEQQGWARINDAAALGKGIVGNQATQQQIATNSGSASVNAGAGGINAAQAGTGIMQTGFNTAQQGLQTAGSLYGQAGQLTSTTRGQDLNFLGNAFNSYMRSSKKVKKGTGNVTDGKEELAEVMATPVDKGWQYAPEKGGPDDGGQVHTGPMAETVRAKMGDEVAPGGEVIDMRQMGGKMLAAIQAVTRDVAELRDQMAARARMGKQPATKEA